MAEIIDVEIECPSVECPLEAVASQKQLEGSSSGRLGQPVVSSRNVPVVILGIDASLKATGLVTVPLDFRGRGDWGRVTSRTLGWSLPSGSTDHRKIDRLRAIVDGTLDFARSHGCSEAWIESYAFGKNTAAHALGEVVGCLKLALRTQGINVRTAPLSSARKALIGYVPKSGAKQAVHDFLVAQGAEFPTGDAYDAMCAAHYGLHVLGGFSFQRGA